MAAGRAGIAQAVGDRLKASTALLALLALDVAAIGMVLGLAWQRAGRVTSFDTLFLMIFLVLVPLVLVFVVGIGEMEDYRPVVFFGAFFGLILLPWLGMYAAFGPGMLKAKGERVTVPEGAYVQEIPLADEAAARAHALENLGGARRGETTIAGVTGWLLSEERPVMFLRQDGKMLRMYQANDRASLETMLRSSAAEDFLDRAGLGKVFGAVVLYTVFVAWSFFRLAGWASVLLPAEGVAAVPAAELRERLLAVAKQDVPFTVRAGDEPGLLVAEWRYADAKWLDHARAHAMHKAIRYEMRLDEPSRSVRVLEYRAEFDASAGVGGAGLQYSVSRGITFFEVRRETVLGVQIKDGKIVPEASYTWRFDVEEIRGPLARIANDAGWAWKPLMLDVPWLGG